MRIGIVSEYARPWPGGISEHVHHEALELRRLGHEVQVVTGGAPVTSALVRSARARVAAEHGQHDGTRVLRVGRALTFTSNGARSRLALGRFAFRMRETLARLALDVVHVHAPLDPCLPLLSAASAPCPVVGTFHASFERHPLWSALYGAQNPLARRALARLHTRIAVSQEAARSAAQYCPGDYTLIPNGVDLARFSPASEPSAGVPRRILFVGRADPRKGLSLLLDAHAALLAERRDVELVLCGVSRRELPRMLPPHVHAFGYVPAHELPQHYREADVVCAPSLTGESQGVVLLEAMASARPVVAFDIPGYREVVRDDVQALLVRERSAAALKAALARVLDDGALRARLGAAGREHAATFAWPSVAKSLEDVLARAASSTERRAAC